MARKKTKRFRGSMTHGKGKKGGRGAGLRGGRGNAGLLKHKWMHMVKYMPDHFGRHGFKRPQSITREIRTINVGQLENRFPGKNDIDLDKEGYDKLLGGGKLNKKFKIKVNSASERALVKVKEKGGEIILPELPEKEPAVEQQEPSAKQEEPAVEQDEPVGDTEVK